MALRTTPAKVKLIFHTYLDEVALVPFIEIANDFVTEQLGSSTLTATRLELIERYLSAHFAQAVDPDVIQEKIGQDTAMYAGDLAYMGMMGTRHGQAAIDLDSTGRLRDIAGSKKKFRWAIGAGFEYED